MIRLPYFVEGRIVREESPGIVAAIRGSAFVMGRLELYVDPTDPFPEGYLLPTPGPVPISSSRKPRPHQPRGRARSGSWYGS